MAIRLAFVTVVVLALSTASAFAAMSDERAQYHRRAAERDLALFVALDRDRDGRLTREEARGDLTLGPRFDDADIDRDGVLTREEINRYVAQRYEVRLPPR